MHAWVNHKMTSSVIIYADDAVGFGGCGFGRVEKVVASRLKFLRADVVVQEDLPVKLDALWETARQKPFEEREVSFENGAVSGEGPVVDGKMKGFLEQQSKDGVGRDVFAQGETQAKRGAVGKRVGRKLTENL